MACWTAGVWAQPDQQPAKPPADAKMPKMAKNPMMTHMENMAKLKTALEAAKTEAAGNAAAVAKIDEALAVLEADHMAAHQCAADMAKMMQEKIDALAAMQKDMEQVKEAMGKSAEMQAMQPKMDQMLQTVKGWQQEMKSDGMMGMDKMKCPMCDKTLGTAPMVANTVCPISGMKIDPYNVPAGQIREYEGMKIGFCSPACPMAWDRLTDVEKKAKTEAMKMMPKVMDKAMPKVMDQPMPMPRPGMPE